MQRIRSVPSAGRGVRGPRVTGETRLSSRDGPRSRTAGAVHGCLGGTAGEPDRPKRERARVLGQPETRLEVLGPKLPGGSILEVDRPRESLPRLLRSVLAHLVLGPGDDLVGAPKRPLRAVTEVLLEVAEAQRVERALPRAPGELQ